MQRVEYLQAKLEEEAITYLGLNETRLSGDILDSRITTPTHLILRDDRNRQGGGVALFYDTSCPVSPLASTKDCQHGVEFLLCKSQITRRDAVHILVVYKPPHVARSVLTTIFHFVLPLLTDADKILLCGDLNIDVAVESGRLFVDDLLATLGLLRLELGPTHVTATSRSTIDVLAFGGQLTLTGQQICPILIGSGHRRLSATFSMNLSSRREVARLVRTRDWSNYSGEAFAAGLNAADWSHYTSSTSGPGVILDQLTGNIYRTLDSIAPWITTRFGPRNIKRLKPPALRRLEAQADKLYRTYLSTFRAQDLYLAREARDSALLAFKSFREAEIAARLRNCSSMNDFWRQLSTWGIVDMPSDFGPEFDHDQYADFLLDLPPLHGTYADPPTSPLPAELQHFSFAEISVADVKRALGEITSAAKGPDQLSPRLLRDFPDLPSHLARLYNSSLVSCTFPVGLKEVKICPVPKVPHPSGPKDYRPIAVASVMAKAFEKVIYKQLRDFISDVKFLDDNQYGFRPKRNTDMAILHLLEFVRPAFQEKEIVLAVFLDFRRAFECVPHAVILSVLASLGVDGPVLDWFRSYLKDRMFFVSGPCGTSRKRRFGHRGVPQGSCLAALLFIIVLNSLLQLLRPYCECIAYADDMVLLFRGSLNDLSDILFRAQFCMIILQQWLIMHGMALNPAKCSFMFFQESVSTQLDVGIFIDDVRLEPESPVKYLGVMLQSDLGWQSHIARVSRRVFIVLRRLSARKSCLTADMRKTLVQALALPHIRYAAAVATDMKPFEQRRMNRLINNCVRFVTPVARFTSVSPARKSLGFPSYLTMRRRATLQLLHKFVHHEVSSGFFCDAIERLTPSSVRLREQRVLNAPRYRTVAFERSFFIQAIRAWNKLPASVRLLPSVKAFKRNLYSAPSREVTIMDRSLFF